MSSSLAHPNDREHGDFYRGLTGLKAQIDEINRDLILLENATLSSSEVNSDWLGLSNKLMTRIRKFQRLLTQSYVSGVLKS
jgi:hypothetical protein